MAAGDANMWHSGLTFSEGLKDQAEVGKGGKAGTQLPQLTLTRRKDRSEKVVIVCVIKLCFSLFSKVCLLYSLRVYNYLQ